MSSLNWEHGWRYESLSTREQSDDNPVHYQLWGLPPSERKWFHDPLASIEKQGKKWELTTWTSSGFQQVRGTYKTLKEATAMGIALVTMEGIKHAV
jgi:hypothetical protein